MRRARRCRRRRAGTTRAGSAPGLAPAPYARGARVEREGEDQAVGVDPPERGPVDVGEPREGDGGGDEAGASRQPELPADQQERSGQAQGQDDGQHHGRADERQARGLGRPRRQQRQERGRARPRHRLRGRPERVGASIRSFEEIAGHAQVAVPVHVEEHRLVVEREYAGVRVPGVVVVEPDEGRGEEDGGERQPISGLARCDGWFRIGHTGIVGRGGRSGQCSSP